MKRILSTSEVLGVVELEQASWELLALAQAEFDESGEELHVQLRTKLRPGNHADQAEPAASELTWLPQPREQTEKVSLSEALPVAREIFQSWARRVRRSIPDELVHFQPSGL